MVVVVIVESVVVVGLLAVTFGWFRCCMVRLEVCLPVPAFPHIVAAFEYIGVRYTAVVRIRAGS